MQLAGSNLTVAATDLSDHVACPHLTSLELGRARGVLVRPRFADPAMDALRRRGDEHEQEVLQAYRAKGLTVVTIPRPEPAESESAEERAQARAMARRAQADRTLAEMRKGVDVVYQGCLYDGRWVGYADFLVRVERPSGLGPWSYEVVDAKLAREPKVRAVLQIACYSEMLGCVQGADPEQMHLALAGRGGPDVERRRGNGGPHDATAPRLESFRFAEFAAYHRSVKRRFLAAIERPEPTYPEPCEHCQICDWSSVCKERWREDDHLSLVAGITRKQRAALEARRCTTLEKLGELALPLDPPLAGVTPRALEKVREQARVQLAGRRAERPLYELLPDVAEGCGLAKLPEPSAGDLFFDIEGDPHAFGDGLEYLFGTSDAEGVYTADWALDRAGEKAAFERFIDRLTARLEQHPDLHVYHFGHYEPTALKRLMGRHATREDEVDRLLRGGRLVDLHRVVVQALRASVESYSIKKLEPLFGYERQVDLRAASSALAHFEAWLALGGRDANGGNTLLEEIERYNEDDCLSTAALRDWLEERRGELERLTGARVPRPEPSDGDPSENLQEVLERVAHLQARLTEGVPDDPAERTEEQQARWILAQLLEWHRRENKSVWWDYFRMRDMDEEELLHDPKPLAGLEYVGEVDQVKKSIVHRYRFPPQDFRLKTGDSARDPRTEKSAGEIVAVDEDARTIDLKRGASSTVPHPSALIPFDYVPDTVLRESLLRLAEDVADHGLAGARNRTAVDLLMRNPPRTGQAPGAALRDAGEESLDAARRLVRRLDGTVLPIQGPPGSGKTYIGARMIVALVRDGKRVGITATSHKVIENLLAEVLDAAEKEGVPLAAVQKRDEDGGHEHRSVECTQSNERVKEALEQRAADVAAGTVWLWAREEMARSVDVLFVDEAGQVSLANVLAAAQAADSVVLLGDPRQLEQPQKGVHPPGTDAAALEHLVGSHTLAPERGLFLEETWRLHPEICAFTSELYYEGRLHSRPELARQRVDGPDPFCGAGLRFFPVEHQGNTSESEEEVRAVAELIDRLLAAGPTWVDAEGEQRPLRPKDILVVAPYNAQVISLRAALPEGVRVGTVDKCQGQEAPIVIYSTASSTAEDAPRGMSFLFSPNRLNVATSRARCLAVWVGSPALYTPVCRSVEQMRLANGVCRLGEVGEETSSSRQP